ncbi:hypothetical protein PGTUg99_023641 [Puccinia graminis f. sp. tritici]|uniref:Uncharacterized protein n=1 Tax=Puccinia graminis f. sp. tritici TaxID=56615 RepID=A0A5B0QRP0_PUCGR|nr:hypothetical protein PGTUg99_023641 [Puccinia graminis f. sp. tritici]
METFNLGPQATSVQVIASVNAACYFVPMMQFISGIVFLQYGKFFSRQAARKSQLSLRLGTVAIILHLGQVVVDLWCLFHSFQYYTSGRPYTYFLYEALQIGFAVGIIFVVQYHFLRLAYATAAFSKRWTIPLRLFCIGACVGGLGTSIGYIRHFLHSGFSSATPLVIRGQLLFFNVVWLGCNGFMDGAITFAMVKALYHGRASIKQKSLRTTLTRLMNIIINTFSLTYLAAMLSLIATILPHMIPNFSFKAEMICQTAGFILNGLLPRIYLISFFCSFQEASFFAPQQYDSCVASMGNISSSRSFQADSFGPTFARPSGDKRASRRPQTRARVQVTHQVQVAVEENIEEKAILIS